MLYKFVFFSLIYITHCFNLFSCIKPFKTTKINLLIKKNYINAAVNLMDLNKQSSYIMHNYNDNKSLLFTYNNTLSFTYDNDSHIKFLFKSKTSYLLTINSNKHKYLITIKAHPIQYNKTMWEVYIKHNLVNAQPSYVNFLIKYWLLNVENNDDNFTNIKPELYKYFLL